MNQVAKAENPHEVMEAVLMKGDLSRLTPEERNSYYRAVCQSVGLNPLTKPLEYIQLNGKLRLYALKDCTDQLRSIHKVSVTDMTETERDGVYIVTSKVCNADGRTDIAKGAVNIQGLKGEALANAIMKAETKSKRRATLSICGLGMLDETEVDDIPASQKAPVPISRDSSPPRIIDRTGDAANKPIVVEQPKAKSPDPIVQPSKPNEGPHKIVGGTYASWTQAFIEAVQTSDDPSVVMAWVDANTAQLEKLGKGSPEHAAMARSDVEKHLAFLRKTAPKAPETVAEQPVLDMGEDGTQEPKKPRGRPKGSGMAIPDFMKDYDGWLNWCLKQIGEAETIERLDELCEVMDSKWEDLMPPDKQTLSEARSMAEDRLLP